MAQTKHLSSSLTCSNINCTDVNSSELQVNNMVSLPSSDPFGAEVTLNGSGVATVTNAQAVATSLIFVSQLDGGTGRLDIARSAGSFTITSSVGLTDSGKKVAYIIIN